MTRADDVETFRNLLTAATQLVDAEYFLLPVADQNGGEPIIQYASAFTRTRVVSPAAGQMAPLGLLAGQ